MIEKENSSKEHSKLLARSQKCENPLDSAFTFVGALPGFSYSANLKDEAQEKKESTFDISIYEDRERI